MKKIKQLFCRHEDVYFVIDLDAIYDKKLESAKCPDCGKKFVFKLTTYSLFEDHSKKKASCKKRSYDKETAQFQLNRCRRLKRKRQPERIYNCPDCNKWHLTSKKQWN